MEDSPDVYADTYPVFHPSSPPETEGVVPSTPVLRVVKGGGVGGGSSSGVPSGLNTPSSVASSQGLWGMPPRSRRSSRSGTPAPTSQGLLPAQRELADVVRNIWSWGNGGSRAATPVMSSPGDAKVPSTPSVEGSPHPSPCVKTTDRLMTRSMRVRQDRLSSSTLTSAASLVNAPPTGVGNKPMTRNHQSRTIRESITPMPRPQSTQISRPVTRRRTSQPPPPVPTPRSIPTPAVRSNGSTTPSGAGRVKRYLTRGPQPSALSSAPSGPRGGEVPSGRANVRGPAVPKRPKRSLITPKRPRVGADGDTTGNAESSSSDDDF